MKPSLHQLMGTSRYTPREIRAMLKEYPGVYLISSPRFHHPLRISQAKLVHGHLFVLLLATGKWVLVFPADQIEGRW